MISADAAKTLARVHKEKKIEVEEKNFLEYEKTILKIIDTLIFDKCRLGENKLVIEDSKKFCSFITNSSDKELNENYTLFGKRFSAFELIRVFLNGYGKDHFVHKHVYETFENLGYKVRFESKKLEETDDVIIDNFTIKWGEEEREIA